MFPYYWNGFNSSAPYAASITGLLRKDALSNDLPDEVLESLELHRNEINSVEDKKRFLHDLDLRK